MFRSLLAVLVVLTVLATWVILIHLPLLTYRVVRGLLRPLPA